MKRNSFEDLDVFSDPSIQAAVSSSDSEFNKDAVGSSDYNPFVMRNQAMTSPSSSSAPASSEMDTKPTVRAKEEVMSVVQKQVDTLRAHQASLNAAAASAASSGADNLGSMGDTSYPSQLKNFPPIPSFCPFQPCFRQDIHMDIPIAYQKWARYCLLLCTAMQVVMLTNFSSMFLYLIEDAKEAWKDFVLSIVWLVLIGPCAYVGWFRPIYNALRDDSSMNFMLFFFMFFIHMVFVMLMIIGIPDWGFAGFIVMIKMLSSKGFIVKLAGIMAIITIIGLVGIATSSLFILLKIRNLYTTSSASIERAQQELAGTVWANESARRAASAVFRQATFGPPTSIP